MKEVKENLIPEESEETLITEESEETLTGEEIEEILRKLEVEYPELGNLRQTDTSEKEANQ